MIFLKVICTSLSLNIIAEILYKVAILYQGVLYDKIGTMNSLSLRYYDVGYITNLVTSDLFAILSFTRFSIEIFKIPLYIVTVTALVSWNFGWVGLAIPLILLINFVVQYGFSTMMA